MSVSSLSHLSPEELHHHTCQASLRLAEGEWELASCLLAVERTRLYRQHQCRTAVHYATHVLELSPHKARELLRVARALESLPRITECFRSGKLSWSKIREVTRVATADSEEQWLEFVQQHPASAIPKPRTARTKRICVRLYFTPDQYAAWEKAQEHVRGDRELDAAETAAAVAEQVLAAPAAPVDKLRTMVVVNLEAARGAAYYETGLGPMPASEAAVREGIARGELLLVRDRAGLPTDILKALVSRAGHRCESSRCNKKGPLHVIRLKRRRGGGLARLALRCVDCSAGRRPVKAPKGRRRGNAARRAASSRRQ